MKHMLRKSLLAALVMIATAAPLASAEDASVGLDLVLFGGYARSHFSGSDKVFLGGDNRDGALAGLAFMARVTPVYGFEADVRVTQKGGQGDVDITDYSGSNSGPTYVGNGETRLTYVEIPLLFTVQMGIGQHGFVRAFGGPSFNILASADFEGSLQGVDQKVDLKDGVTSTDYNIVLGAGYCHDFGEVSAWLDGRLCTGLSTVDDTSKDRDIKNQSWEVALGVGIPLARQ